MAQTNTALRLLDECVQAAVNLGLAKARELEDREYFANLKVAMQNYISSCSFMNMDEQPDLETVRDEMTKVAYVAYLYGMGEIGIEQLPEALRRLESFR